MAPSRGTQNSRQSASSRPGPPTRRTPRSSKNPKDVVSDVYSDLLAEASIPESPIDSDRPLKRRRVAAVVGSSAHTPSRRGKTAGRRSSSLGHSSATSVESGDEPDTASSPYERNPQAIEQSSSDDESEFAFEDVDLERPIASSPASAEDDHGIADVSVAIDSGATPSKPVQARRKPLSAAEKAHRLFVHKAHVLGLLGHCIYANSRCNDERVHEHLRPLLNQRNLAHLRPRVSDSQFQRNRAFIDGLQQASVALRAQFDVNASGMKKAHWMTEGEEGEMEVHGEVMDRVDFISAAKNLQGSQDTGNQLFCALLRAVGVETRLVCSLQPLPFASTPAKPPAPNKAPKATVYALASDNDQVSSRNAHSDTAVASSRTVGTVPTVRRRLGQPSFGTQPALKPSLQEKPKPVRRLDYPVFWVEAFNAAHQRWIAVDPVVTQTVNNPSKLEPPLSYGSNQLSYVVAFESNGVARDVTRRYTKAYNAKTRRQRVESTVNGTGWFKRTMRFLSRRGYRLDRDQVEDAELAQKEASESMPNNVQDFKDHPYYALERHLRRHEVLHPRREVGKVNAGTNAKPRMEAVYRRRDVLVCRSADKWYRLGREIKAGEQPLKHAAARVRPGGSLTKDTERDENETAGMTALYGAFQTELYVAPPVRHGRIPRNVFGNLDVYVPSMVPAGGVHIRHALTQRAARILGVDYADAVTGFQFKGRHGTAIIQGAVVAADYADAVNAVIEGLEDAKEEDDSLARSLVALKMWKRFLTGLRVAETVAAYGDATNPGEVKRQMDNAEDEDERMEEAGGFLSVDATTDVPLPTAGRFSVTELSRSMRPAKNIRSRMLSLEDEEDDPMEPADNELTESFGARGHLPSDPEDIDDDTDRPDDAIDELKERNRVLSSSGHADEGGGFVPDEDMEDEGGGGFIPDEQMETTDPSSLSEDDEESRQSVRNASDSVAFEESLRGPTGLLQGTELANDGAQIHQSQSPEVAPPTDPQASDRGPDELPTPSDNGVAQSEIEDQAHTTSTLLEQDTKKALLNTLQTHPSDDDGHVRNDDASDHGSLLSHDPEDEDAEPDWLESE